MYRARLTFLVGLSLWWGHGSLDTAVAGETPQPGEPVKKLPLPSADDQKRARQMIDEVVGKSLTEAKFSEQKEVVAKQLLRLGLGTHDDSAGQFVLFSLARDVGAEGGDWETVTAAIIRLGENFEVDTLEMKADLMAKIAKATSTKDTQGLYPRFQEVIEEAIWTDRYEIAKGTNSAKLLMAQQARDVEMMKQIGAFGKQLVQFEGDLAKAKTALDILATQPSEPNANLIVGKYWCFIKGDWKRGLPLLALGNDDKLKSIAQLELVEKPDALKLGDGWWDVAQSQKGRAQEIIRTRAGEWYRKLSGLTGLMKARVETRLDSLPKPKITETEVQQAKETKEVKGGKKIEPSQVEARVNKSPLVGTNVDREALKKLREENGPDATKIGNHYYQVFLQDNISWSEACDACTKMGGYLVCADEKAEFKDIVLLNSEHVLWVGCSAKKDSPDYEWLNGQPYWRKVFSDNKKEPYMSINSSNAIQTRPTNGRVSKVGVGGYICEWDY